MVSISASMDIKEMYEDLIPVLFACIYFRHFDEFYAWDSLVTWIVFGALLFTYSYFWLLEPELSPRFIKILTVVGVMVAAHDCIYICVALCNCYRANSVGFCYEWKNSGWTLLVAGAFRFVGIFFLISCSSFGGNAHQECDNDQTQPSDLIIVTRRRRITTIGKYIHGHTLKYSTKTFCFYDFEKGTVIIRYLFSVITCAFRYCTCIS